MDFKDAVKDRYIGMENTLLESKLYGEYYGLNEGLIAKIKQARADKKARKAAAAERKRLEEEEKKEQRQREAALRKQKQQNSAMMKYHIFKREEEPTRDLKKLAMDIAQNIKKEIPAVRLNVDKISHGRTKFDDGYVLHTLQIRLFTMDDRNLKSFIENTKDRELKAMHSAEKAIEVGKKINNVAKMISGGSPINGNDAALGFASSSVNDKIRKLVDADFERRIVAPILDMGFNGKRNMFVLDKDDKEYFFFKKESFYFGYEIKIGVRFLTEPAEGIDYDRGDE
jgi:hypothetical protein